LWPEKDAANDARVVVAIVRLVRLCVLAATLVYLSRVGVAIECKPELIHEAIEVFPIDPETLYP
jgi:hypothetical protein